MAWTAGKTWTTGEVVTGWKLQTYWSDNMMSARNLWNRACQVTLTSSPEFTIGQSDEWTPIPYREITWRVGSTAIFSTAEPTKFMVPLAGWYELTPVTSWNNASGGTRSQGYRLNGGPPIYDQHSLQTNNNSFRPILNSVDIVQMTTADFAEVMAKQNSAEPDIGMAARTRGTRCTWRLIGASS